MKHLKLFKTKEEYEAFKASGEYLTPNVSFIETAGSVINDSYQIQGGSTIEYIDVTGLDEDMRWAFLNYSSLAKWKDSYSGDVYISPTLFAKRGADDLYEEAMAIAIDFSAMVTVTADSLGSVKESMSLEYGYSLEMLDFIPRITKEEFYNIEGGNSISFTIDGTSFIAEEGMTWLDFVNSEYSNDDFYVNAYDVKYQGFVFASSTNEWQSGDSVIIANEAYRTIQEE